MRDVLIKAETSVDEYSEFKIFRKQMKKMVKVKCEICGKTKNLVTHHKDCISPQENGYYKIHRNREDNLQVLCRLCHLKVHKIFKENRKNRGEL
ncbi:HNH endonuclease [Cetobacterium sp. ZWU0022]|uniref:HNH endonuclease n=1 Tax=Cetobacterium sp. ZWU0022 TaxID=1340502 RepID=UPI0006484E6B|nr:HNH endonuclease [Cetobacterium sp. ZWU0022]